MNRIKKLLGMCEHDWRFVYIKRTSHYDLYGSSKRYDSLSFTVKIMCKNCGKYDTIESEYFDEDALEDLRKFFLDI